MRIEALRTRCAGEQALMKATDLKPTDSKATDLTRADLTRTDWTRTDLTRADLRSPDVQENPDRSRAVQWERANRSTFNVILLERCRCAT